uniref:Uncharacterized protein n=1 Tax=Aegilops tauschii subsp. strangulata TaxID=200361 RepID=A0A453NJF9_AEGTS
TTVFYKMYHNMHMVSQRNKSILHPQLFQKSRKHLQPFLSHPPTTETVHLSVFFPRLDS